MKQRILSMFLALVLLFGLLPAAAMTVGAADAVEAWKNEITVMDTLEADLIAAIRAGKSSISILSYHLLSNDIDLNRLKGYSPYVSNGIDIRCEYIPNGYYTTIKITYPDTLSLDEINAYYDRVDAKIAEVDAMLAAVPDNVDKVLVLHDYLAFNSEYDLAQEISPDSFNTAGILMKERGVCQGYTYAFMYLMNRAGIECHPVESAAMNHTWDVVRIGDDYYHVDPTWDDPTPDVPGMVGHKFVLLSDAAVSVKRSIGGNKPHYDWDPLPVSCSSTEYDNAYWYGVDSRVLFSGDDRYYCRNGSIVKRDLKGAGETALISVGDWPVWGETLQFYTEYFTGLDLQSGKLYYNTATELRCIDVETLEDKTVYVPDTTAGYLYGCAVIDGVMYYEIKQSPNETGVRHSIPFEKLTGEHVHSYTAVVTPPTCTEQGYTTHTCACGDSYVDAYVNALGHAWDEGKVTVEPTETTKGEKTFTCTRCGATQTEDIPKLQHTHSYTAVVTPPTCTEQGYTTHTCACGDSYVDSYVDALGHDLVTRVAVPPTCTEPGLTAGEHCTRCGYQVAQQTVAALGHDYRSGVCTRCGAKDPDYQPVTFNDVSANDWFYKAVNYAVDNKLMNGVGNNSFAPNASMTRAMLVTVLWRYEGSPEKGTNNFNDVQNGQWFTQAVAWAAAEGIVGGVGSGKFDPNGNITREQMAAILFRYANGKGFDTSRRGDLSGFPDASKVSSWAQEAIAWAVGEGLINGSDGKLMPQGNATRAQVSTILMRFIENIAKKYA